MKNKAKCKLCNSIIESFHATDYVICSCGEIAVDGGDAMRCSAKDFNNFIRVDEKGNEIQVKVINKDEEVKEEPLSKLTRQELIYEIKELIKNIQNLPNHAMQTPLNHYDYLSILMLFASLLDCNDLN